MSEDIFMLYQKEIDAIVKRGYKDALLWLKEASIKFPDSSIEELLAAANSLIKQQESFNEEDTTDVSDASIPEHKHITKATINKVKNKGASAFWEEKKPSKVKRNVLHPVREDVVIVEKTVVDFGDDLAPSIKDAPIFYATKNALVAKEVTVEQENVASEIESLNSKDIIFIEELEAKAAAARREAAEKNRALLLERRAAAEKELEEANSLLSDVQSGSVVEELVENADTSTVIEDKTVESANVSMVVDETVKKRKARNFDVTAEVQEVEEETVGDETEIVIKNKEYVAPEELTVDNTLRPDYIIKKKRKNVKVRGEASTIGVDNTSDVKPATNDAVDTVEVAPKTEDATKHEGPTIGVKDTGADSDIEVIEIDDNVIADDVSLTLKNKEYVAPEELTVDNTLRPDYIIKKKEKEKEKRRGLFGRGKKIEEGEIGVEDSVEIGPITPILAVSQEEAEQTIAYLEESERPWDSEVTGKLTEKTLASNADVKIKGKEYVAPEELTVDISIPVKEEEEVKEPEIVELDDKIIVSDASLTLKNKEYVAPADMTIDNSLKINGEEAEENKTDSKKKLFGSRKSKEVKPVEATKIVYLPAKPIDKNVIAVSNQAEDIEGIPVYRPKRTYNIDALISEDFVAAVATDVAKAQAEKQPEESFFEEPEEFEEETPEWGTVYGTQKRNGKVELDFDAIAREIEAEKRAKELAEAEAADALQIEFNIAAEEAEEERLRLEEELERDYVEKLREGGDKSDIDSKKAAKLIQELKKFDLDF